MESLNELYKKLEDYKDFDADPENVEHFLDTVDEIVLRNDPSSIPVLLSYFDDESEYSWVFESQMLAMEKYESIEFIIHFFPYLVHLIKKSKLRAKAFIYGILNSQKDFQVLLNNIKKLSNPHFVELMKEIEEESPHHKDLIQELRKELDKA